MHQLVFAGSMAAALTLAMATGSSAQKLYPQLMATLYPTGSALPKGVSEPEKRFAYVDPTGLPPAAAILSSARASGGATWVVTDKGAFRSAGDRYVKLVPPASVKLLQSPVPVDTVITCVTADRDGHILAGSNFGLFITDGGDFWHHLDRRDGMPMEVLACMCAASNGDVWAGSRHGAWRLRSGRFRYFAGKRWLPGDRVEDIWEDPKGRVWLHTDGGYACIEERIISLADKAKEFNDLTQKWCSRRGYISQRTLAKPGELEGSVFEVSDNDGLWNAIYAAAMTYRYAATKDESARRDAWATIAAMLDLERLTGISGFPARAVVTDAEIAAGVTGVNLNETVRVPGEQDKIWFRSPLAKDTWCKGDTSSDELDGHYFAWLTYFDLAATPEQKRLIAATCRRVTDNLIAGGFNLIGHTGRKTRWAIFAPETLNDDSTWADQRALNSLDLLGYMKVAAHITGDPKYERTYEMLIHKHHYLLNIMTWRTRGAAEWQAINHSDDEMACMDFHNLLTLEKDPDRRRLLLFCFRNTWEDTGAGQSLKQEHSPLYNFMYGGLTGQACASDEAVETLQDWPWDRFEWTMKNSGRADVTFMTGQGLDAERELSRVLPASERALHRWNGNPFKPDGGADGRIYDDGAAWLLGYWLGVYYGYIPLK